MEGLEFHAEPESGGGLTVCITVSPDISKRIADGGPINLAFSVPDAAPAPFTLQTAAPDTLE